MSNRIKKGSEAGEFKGQGSSYVIPRDDLPEGLKSGENIIAKIYGVININEDGGVITVDKIEFEKLNSRDDPLQKKIEEGLSIMVKIKK